MIHILRKKPKYAISFVVFRGTKKTNVEIETEYTFQNLNEAAVFLQHLFESDMGIISYFSQDEIHYLKTQFYYGLKYLIEYDDIRIAADVNKIDPAKKIPLFVAKDVLQILKLRSRR